jgi:hypothetical protein
MVLYDQGKMPELGRISDKWVIPNRSSGGVKKNVIAKEETHRVNLSKDR